MDVVDIRQTNPIASGLSPALLATIMPSMLNVMRDVQVQNRGTGLLHANEDVFLSDNTDSTDDTASAAVDDTNKIAKVATVPSSCAIVRVCHTICTGFVKLFGEMRDLIVIGFTWLIARCKDVVALCHSLLTTNIGKLTLIAILVLCIAAALNPFASLLVGVAIVGELLLWLVPFVLAGVKLLSVIFIATNITALMCLRYNKEIYSFPPAIIEAQKMVKRLIFAKERLTRFLKKLNERDQDHGGLIGDLRRTVEQMVTILENLLAAIQPGPQEINARSPGPITNFAFSHLTNSSQTFLPEVLTIAGSLLDKLNSLRASGTLDFHISKYVTDLGELIQEVQAGALVAVVDDEANVIQESYRGEPYATGIVNSYLRLFDSEKLSPEQQEEQMNKKIENLDARLARRVHYAQAYYAVFGNLPLPTWATRQNAPDSCKTSDTKVKFKNDREAWKKKVQVAATNWATSNNIIFAGATYSDFRGNSGSTKKVKQENCFEWRTVTYSNAPAGTDAPNSPPDTATSFEVGCVNIEFGNNIGVRTFAIVVDKGNRVWLARAEKGNDKTLRITHDWVLMEPDVTTVVATADSKNQTTIMKEQLGRIRNQLTQKLESKEERTQREKTNREQESEILKAFTVQPDEN
ncbi:MAG: hypothetical protein LBP65_00225 [Puniceicoccales bacterium]|nr:hypothetical protein [Puniceicoccales bacterium]